MKSSTYQTGDVLAVYGKGAVSRVIRYWTGLLRLLTFRPCRCPSHVAVIIVTTGVIWVLESTSIGKLKDAITGDRREGVQMHKLLDWLSSQAGPIKHFPLKTPLLYQDKAIEYAMSLHKRKVGYSKLMAAHAASPVINSSTGDPLFCSALVGFALRHGGAVDSSINCNELTPCDVIKLPILAAGRDVEVVNVRP